MPQTNAEIARELAKLSADCSFLLTHLIRDRGQTLISDLIFSNLARNFLSFSSLSFAILARRLTDDSPSPNTLPISPPR
jgi:hypothetical protein